MREKPGTNQSRNSEKAYEESESFREFTQSHLVGSPLISHPSGKACRLRHSFFSCFSLSARFPPETLQTWRCKGYHVGHIGDENKTRKASDLDDEAVSQCDLHLTSWTALASRYPKPSSPQDLSLHPCSIKHIRVWNLLLVTMVPLLLLFHCLII